MSKAKLPETMTITVEIDAALVASIGSDLVAKEICGAFCGPEDEFCLLVIGALRKGEDRICIIPKPAKRSRK